MITRDPRQATSAPEREAPPGPPSTTGAGGPPRGPSGRGSAWPWWRSWPTPPNRPRPLNRRSFLIGSAVVLPALLLLDGLLGWMAAYATGRLAVGLAVFAGMLVITSLELGIVAWASKRRQDEEARRAGPD